MRELRLFRLALTTALTIALAAAVLCWADTELLLEPGSEVGNAEEVPALTQATDAPVVEPWQCETDPFRRCALKALAGEFGDLHEWQRLAYAAGLLQGCTASWPLVLTQYNPGEGRQGQVDRYGRKCTMRTAASNLLPRYSYVWTELSGMRQVLDCGSRANDPKARRIGGARAIWVDVWMPSARAARVAGIDGWTLCKGTVIEL